MPKPQKDIELTERWIEAIEELIYLGIVESRKDLAKKVVGLTPSIITNVTSGLNGITQKLAEATYNAFPNFISKDGLLLGKGDVMLIMKKTTKQDIAAQLKKVSELYKENLLTKQEFEQAKKLILG